MGSGLRWLKSSSLEARDFGRPLKASKSLTKLLGFHVIATARNKIVVEDLAARGFSAVQLDVCDAESIAVCRAEVGRLVNGKLDILMNNA